MVGNDVVDLGDPDTTPGARHPRFDDRVFAPSEREALEASGAPNRLRWILWAAKQAACQVARKLDPGAAFSPSQYVVRLESNLRGSVEVGEHCLSLWVDETPDRVHAIVSDVDATSERIHGEVAALASRVGARHEEVPAAAASGAARALARISVAERLGAELALVSVAHEGRIPLLLLKGEPSGIDLSLSHHGRFVAFACDYGDERAEAR